MLDICPDECPSTMGGSCACKPVIYCPICSSNVNECDCVYHLEGLARNAYYTSIQLQERENA